MIKKVCVRREREKGRRKGKGRRERGKKGEEAGSRKERKIVFLSHRCVCERFKLQIWARWNELHQSSHRKRKASVCGTSSNVAGVRAHRRNRREIKLEKETGQLQGKRQIGSMTKSLYSWEEVKLASGIQPTGRRLTMLQSPAFYLRHRYVRQAGVGAY